ncbi:hypothetical protein CCUS01_05929 [Colletotrichum cuscutae]|uniref:Uncharacterized protein n=1 Tax=Colletotrichum cuscutae TaxID=1209917 RepID=A0AAI9V7R5_9PEZI|nr:hypothetical protein CCUS01_05929 [Colletotrichum cuscutae]
MIPAPPTHRTAQKVRQPARLLAQAEPLKVDQAIAQPREVALGAVNVALQELLLLKVSTAHRPYAARQFVDLLLGTAEDCQWLMVFDNAEESALLREHWPLPGTRGQALITTQNRSLASDLAHERLEIPPLNPEDSAQSLLSFLADHVKADLLETEKKSAYILSEILGGSVPAPAMVGGLTKNRGQTLSECRSACERLMHSQDNPSIVSKAPY